MPAHFTPQIVLLDKDSVTSLILPPNWDRINVSLISVYSGSNRFLTPVGYVIDKMPLLMG